MALVRVYQGQNVEASAAFRDREGNTIVGTGEAATWTVRDWDGNMIASGSGSQDMSHPELWLARFAMPASAPIAPNGERYQILWELPLAQGSVSAIERFEVQAFNDPTVEAQNPDVMVLEGNPIIDSLTLPEPVVEDSLKYEVRSINNALILEETSMGGVPDRSSGNAVYYDFNSGNDINVSNFATNPLMGVWEYQLPGETTSYEFHSIYITNLQAISLIKSMRQYIDRANLADIHPFLTFTDLDLMHFLLRGFEYLNSKPPSITQWNTRGFPVSARDYIIKAGAMFALHAQYLAEGMTTFDFQGLGVQLSTDRTQFIQTIYSELNQDLENNFPRFKRTLIKQSGPGVLSVSVSPLTSFVQDVNVDFYHSGELFRAFPFIVLGY